VPASRQCLLFESGATRFLLPAATVLEVAQPDPTGNTLHGHHALKDLSVRLGGAGEVRPGVALLLDTSPTLAIRVARVYGVADLVAERGLRLPKRLGAALEPVVKGAIEHEGRLWLELDPEAMVKSSRAPAAFRVVEPFAPAKGRCLLFESCGRRLALTLEQVAQVVPADNKLVRFPDGWPAEGVVIHQGQLWPVYALGPMLGEPRAQESLIVLAKVRDEPVGLSAEKALGVQAATEGTQLLDLERVFS
jgi:chemotaxis signal transduction protein